MRVRRKIKKELLRNVVERVVVNPEGKLERVDLLPPCAYLLQDVSEKVGGGEDTSENSAEIKHPVIMPDVRMQF